MMVTVFCRHKWTRNDTTTFTLARLYLHTGPSIFYGIIVSFFSLKFKVFNVFSVTQTCSIETMLLHEMGPQLKLPINVKKGSMLLQCNTYVTG